MTVLRLILSFSIACCLALICHSQKSETMRPRWISSTPKACNSTYDFVVIRATGSTPQVASGNCRNRLMDNVDLRSSVEAIVSRHSQSRQHQQFDNGVLEEHIENTVNVDVVVNGQKIEVTANPVDEYWEYIDMRGERLCECYTLYMVAVDGVNPIYDRVSFTQYYGMRGFVRSLIPGCGQIYKGSTTKGLLILGGEAACVAGIVLCESNRSSYARKIKSEPQHAVTYNNKKNNWSTGRNVCIGAAAALYVYNLVDAFVAKGAKRTIVKPRNPMQLSVAPMLTEDMMGMGVMLRF